ncbi:MAG TPA: hypothetical protein VEZ89_05630 [Rubrivivax sp.]|nr:hypothetical protein [Rubrivivax sp.]
MPPPAVGDELRALAHAESARQLSVLAMLSVPVKHDAQNVGDELRAQPFT